MDIRKLLLRKTRMEKEDDESETGDPVRKRQRIVEKESSACHANVSEQTEHSSGESEDDAATEATEDDAATEILGEPVLNPETPKYEVGRFP